MYKTQIQLHFIQVKKKIQLPDPKVCSHTLDEKLKNMQQMGDLADSCRELTTQIKVNINCKNLSQLTEEIHSNKR